MSLYFKDNQLLFADGGLAMSEECCCEEGTPIPCATINDEPTRATWEVSYEIIGLSIGSEFCGAACNSVVPLAGVASYVGAGFSLDWYRITGICGVWSYQVAAGIRCLSGVVTLELGLITTSSATGGNWGISWKTTVPESSFILGTEFILPRQTASASRFSVCLPTPSNGIGTTCKFTVALA